MCHLHLGFLLNSFFITSARPGAYIEADTGKTCKRHLPLIAAINLAVSAPLSCVCSTPGNPLSHLEAV